MNTATLSQTCNGHFPLIRTTTPGRCIAAASTACRKMDSAWRFSMSGRSSSELKPIGDNRRTWKKINADTISDFPQTTKKSILKKFPLIPPPSFSLPLSLSLSPSLPSLSLSIYLSPSLLPPLSLSLPPLSLSLSLSLPHLCLSLTPPPPISLSLSFTPRWERLLLNKSQPSQGSGIQRKWVKKFPHVSSLNGLFFPIIEEEPTKARNVWKSRTFSVCWRQMGIGILFHSLTPTILTQSPCENTKWATEGVLTTRRMLMSVKAK